MKRAVILSLIMIWALVASGSAPARADDNADANRLMVETVGLLKQTRAEIDPEHQFELITMVEANLLRIIDEYPGSNAAVALATGQGIGMLSLELVASEKAKYVAQAIATQAEREFAECFTVPSRRCLLAHALAMAQSFSDERNHDFARIDIAEVQMKAGDFEEALVTIEGVRDDGLRDWMIAEAAVEEATAGNAKGALATARKIGDLGYRARILARLARLQIDAGGIVLAKNSIAEALDAVTKTKRSDYYGYTLAVIARAQNEAGDVDQAQQTIFSALASAKEVREADTNVLVLAPIIHDGHRI